VALCPILRWLYTFLRRPPARSPGCGPGSWTAGLRIRCRRHHFLHRQLEALPASSGAVRGALTRAFAGSRTPDATYRQENIIRYLRPGLTLRTSPAPPAPQWPPAPSAARDWDFKGLTPGQDGQMSRLREHHDSSEEDGPGARGRRWRSGDAPLRAGGERAIGRTTVVSVVAMSCGLGQTGPSPRRAVWGSLASSLITRLEGVPCQSGTKRVSWGLVRPDQSGRGGCPWWRAG
jgi:hypothetical protein